jgi:hypothetical protein
MLPSPTALYSFLSTAAIARAAPHAENQITPSSSLNWAPCALDFPPTVKALIAGPIDCATLDVPLDYTGQYSNDTLALTLIKHKATKQPFKGTVIFQPGGPGASGVEELATKGHTYRDDILGGQFDVVSIDPR